MALIPGSKKSQEDKKAEQEAARDEALLREIDDAVREDQYLEFAKNYGRPILGVVVAGLAAFGGYLFWDGQREARLESQSERLIAALDQAEAGNADSAESTAAALAAEGEGGAKAAAQLMQAGIAMNEGRTAEAIELYAAVSNDADAPPALRDLATIREVAASYDTRDPAEVVERLGPMAVPGNPWFGSAGELVAMAHLEMGNREQAGTLFAEISRSDGVPESLQSRARQMAGLLGVDAIDDVDEFMEDQRAPEQPEQAAAAAH